MMVSINPTLVETVSINYEDFSESFLTCGTCLCVYNGVDHIPKLLPCSHTVCLGCLDRIADVRSREIGVFRCPICRELTNIPQGGISALPPSFLVNRLLDLMSRQRRQIVPTCSDHSNQVLYTCETCDVIFCTMCQNGAGHKPMNEDSKNCEHTIVPYSVAIKRMAEILIYKANECLAKLNSARDTVNDELDKLDRTGNECVQNLNKTFQDIHEAIDRRKTELISKIQEMKENKKTVLNEQLLLIDDEKSKVEKVCDGLEYQTDTHVINQRISSLSENIDSIRILEEPRENSYIYYNIDHEQKYQKLLSNIATLGRIISTTSLPRLSTLQMEDNYVVNLEATALICTIDYHGKARTSGGDPVFAQLHRKEATETIPIPVRIEDLDDGTYSVKFRPPKIGCYVLEVFILGRHIKDGIRSFMVSKHNNPVIIHGCSSADGSEQYLQPVAVAFNNNSKLVYVVDTGNSRIKVLTSELKFVKHIENPCLKGRTCTGIGIFSSSEKASDDWIAVVNWRTRYVTRLTTDGETINEFTHDSLSEPTHLAVDNKTGRIIVVDSKNSSILIFDPLGELILQFDKNSAEDKSDVHISCVCVGLNSEIYVADTRIQVFSSDAVKLKEINVEGDGDFNGISMDNKGLLVATRSTKRRTRHYIQVIDTEHNVLLNTIDSHNSRLCRPAGVACTTDNHTFVVDLGNQAVKKYRYW